MEYWTALTTLVFWRIFKDRENTRDKTLNKNVMKRFYYVLRTLSSVKADVCMCVLFLYIFCF